MTVSPTPEPRPQPSNPQDAVQEPVEDVPAKKPSLFARAYTPETRSGQRMRSFTRVLALVVGFYALGVLSVYLLLYRPAEEARQTAQAEATQVAVQLQTQEAVVDRAENSRNAVQAQSEQAQSALGVEQTRVSLLRALNEVTKARLALANRDTAGAEKALVAAENVIKGIKPPQQPLTEAQKSTLDALFTLAKNDLQRDAKLAAQDFDRLVSELEQAEKNVQP